ncbi:MAG TPA: sulfatase-like hydrolase/transferase, partial [Candidatus Sumerlaeota bacterium]|nr:sulfatase-like hydrolase/transferase [Candidatus Sumerlaeota bacterium]
MHLRYLILAILLAMVGVVGAQETEKKPNIVFIFSDDHAWQTISAYSNKLMKTPNFDRIAKDGIVFKNAYVPNPICGPSRANVLTGKYSHANHYYRNGTEPFDVSQWTFPKEMQSAGYDTAIIGKWHLGNEAVPPGFNYSLV